MWAAVTQVTVYVTILHAIYWRGYFTVDIYILIIFGAGALSLIVVVMMIREGGQWMNSGRRTVLKILPPSVLADTVGRRTIRTHVLVRQLKAIKLEMIN